MICFQIFSSLPTISKLVNHCPSYSWLFPLLLYEHRGQIQTRSGKCSQFVQTSHFFVTNLHPKNAIVGKNQIARNFRLSVSFTPVSLVHISHLVPLVPATLCCIFSKLHLLLLCPLVHALLHWWSKFKHLVSIQKRIG